MTPEVAGGWITGILVWLRDVFALFSGPDSAMFVIYLILWLPAWAFIQFVRGAAQAFGRRLNRAQVRCLAVIGGAAWAYWVIWQLYPELPARSVHAVTVGILLPTYTWAAIALAELPVVKRRLPRLVRVLTLDRREESTRPKDGKDRRHGDTFNGAL